MSQCGSKLVKSCGHCLLCRRRESEERLNKFKKDANQKNKELIVSIKGLLDLLKQEDCVTEAEIIHFIKDDTPISVKRINRFQKSKLITKKME